MLATKKKQAIVKKAQIHEKDTGSSAVQFAMLTEQIERLSEHLKSNKKDNHSRRGLLAMVARRRTHMKFLEKNDSDGLAKLKTKLGLKK